MRVPTRVSLQDLNSPGLSSACLFLYRVWLLAGDATPSKEDGETKKKKKKKADEAPASEEKPKKKKKVEVEETTEAPLSEEKPKKKQKKTAASISPGRLYVFPCNFR